MYAASPIIGRHRRLRLSNEVKASLGFLRAAGRVRGLHVDDIAALLSPYAVHCIVSRRRALR